MSFPLLALRGAACAFGATGLAWLLAPALLAPLVGIELATPTALADARAVYGGLECGFGWLLWHCSRDAARFELGLTAALLGLAGLALGRGLGIALDGPNDAFGDTLLALEVTGAVCVAIARVRLDRRR